LIILNKLKKIFNIKIKNKKEGELLSKYIKKLYMKKHVFLRRKK
jgi:hypothetical protein